MRKMISIWVGAIHGYLGCFSLTMPGTSLRELIHEYKYQTLTLFKCCLLQPKVINDFECVQDWLLTTTDALFRLSL